MSEVVFASIVIARFLIPLTIPKYPLPGVLAALIIDAADQSIFSAFDAEPDNYQSYDKALDIYYLTIAYVSTVRNWLGSCAFRTSQFLWYYRLVGVVAFELSGSRTLLLIFPNTFEYFFLLYEGMRLLWNPRRLTSRAVIGSAAAIWVFIKLPQEWWIHIAQLDLTDELADNSWIWPILVVVFIGFAALAYAKRAHLPERDWSLTFYADAHATTAVAAPADRPVATFALLEHPLLEKTILIGLVSVIFVQLFPDSDARVSAIIGFVAVIVVLNSVVGSLIAGRGRSWTDTGASFLATGVLNVGIYVALQVLTGSRGEGGFGGLLTVFLLALLTLIGTLYDRFRQQRIQSYGLA